MPIFDYACGNGHVMEFLVPRGDSPPPACRICNEVTRRLPSACGLSGIATPGLSRAQMPQTWRGTYGADPQYVAQLRRQWEARQRLEEKYPELRGDQRPILAHEGHYHGAPLRLGDVPRHLAPSSDADGDPA